jgi:hypothetical protein
MTWTIGNSQNSSAQGIGSVSITAPSGITAGDLLVAATNVVVGAGTDPGTPTFPSGWSQITSDFLAPNSHGSLRLTTAYKIATGSEPASYSVTWTTTTANCSWGIVDITGNSTAPLEQSSSDPVHSNANITAPALAGLSANTDLLIGVFADTGGGNPYTPPTGMTNIFNNNQGNNNFGFLAFSYLALATNSSSAEAMAGLNDISDGVALAFLQSGGAPQPFSFPRRNIIRASHGFNK